MTPSGSGCTGVSAYAHRKKNTISTRIKIEWTMKAFRSPETIIVRCAVLIYSPWPSFFKAVSVLLLNPPDVYPDRKHTLVRIRETLYSVPRLPALLFALIEPSDPLHHRRMRVIKFGVERMWVKVGQIFAGQLDER